VPPKPIESPKPAAAPANGVAKAADPASNKRAEMIKQRIKENLLK